jgi:hypothetical protein
MLRQRIGRMSPNPHAPIGRRCVLSASFACLRRARCARERRACTMTEPRRAGALAFYDELKAAHTRADAVAAPQQCAHAAQAARVAAR